MLIFFFFFFFERLQIKRRNCWAIVWNKGRPLPVQGPFTHEFLVSTLKLHLNYIHVGLLPGKNTLEKQELHQLVESGQAGGSL